MILKFFGRIVWVSGVDCGVYFGICFNYVVLSINFFLWFFLVIWWF